MARAIATVRSEDDKKPPRLNIWHAGYHVHGYRCEADRKEHQYGSKAAKGVGTLIQRVKSVSSLENRHTAHHRIRIWPHLSMNGVLYAEQITNLCLFLSMPPRQAYTSLFSSRFLLLGFPRRILCFSKNTYAV